MYFRSLVIGNVLELEHKLKGVVIHVTSVIIINSVLGLD